MHKSHHCRNNLLKMLNLKVELSLQQEGQKRYIELCFVI